MHKPKHIHEAKLTKGALPPTRSALLARIKEIKQTHAKSKSKMGAHRSRAATAAAMRSPSPKK